MSQTVMPNDLLVSGNITSKTMNIPAGAVNDAAVAAAAGVQASKLQHQHECEYSQPGAQNAAVERKVVHIVRGATGLVGDFQVGARVAATGNATATIDLQSNGVSLLTGQITLDSTTAAYVLKAGSLAAGALTLAAGNVIEVVISAVNAGSGALAQGLFAEANIREDAQ